MIFFIRAVAAIAATATLQLGVMRVVSAQNDDSWCFDSRFDNLNATASYSVPGFTPPGDASSPDSTWTFSTGVVTYDGNITQKLWINTSPAIQIDSDELPYQGCVITLFDLAVESREKGQSKDGDCNSPLGQECVTALLKMTNEIASNLSANADEDFQRYKKTPQSNLSFESAQCEEFVINIPSECAVNSTDFLETPAIGHRPPIWINATLARESGYGESGLCPNLGNGTAATSPVLGFETLPDSFEPVDLRIKYRTYDQRKNQVLPVLVPVWSKDSKEAWSDSRLICMRAEEIKHDTSGSGTGTGTGTETENPAPAQSTTPARPNSGLKDVVGYSRATMIGLSVITALLMMMMTTMTE